MLIVFGLFIAITLLSGLVLLVENLRSRVEPLRRYLRDIIDQYQGLSPGGFAQQSALISVNVPLDDIFIRLRVIPDRPLYDNPTEQTKLLKALRQNSDLSPEPSS